MEKTIEDYLKSCGFDIIIPQASRQIDPKIDLHNYFYPMTDAQKNTYQYILKKDDDLKKMAKKKRSKKGK